MTLISIYFILCSAIFLTAADSRATEEQLTSGQITKEFYLQGARAETWDYQKSTRWREQWAHASVLINFRELRTRAERQGRKWVRTACLSPWKKPISEECDIRKGPYPLSTKTTIRCVLQHRYACGSHMWACICTHVEGMHVWGYVCEWICMFMSMLHMDEHVGWAYKWACVGVCIFLVHVWACIGMDICRHGHACIGNANCSMWIFFTFQRKLAFMFMDIFTRLRT